MNFDTFQKLIEQWADSRGIYAHSTSSAQLFKAVSELGELCDAQIKNRRTEKVDGIGDVIVCLINYARMEGITFSECFDHVWPQLNARQGRMVAGGAFIKDADTTAAEWREQGFQQWNTSRGNCDVCGVDMTVNKCPMPTGCKGA